MWLKAAKISLHQARHGGAEMWGLWIGVLHCVNALHHVRKCVEMARANVADQVAQDVGSFLEAFDDQVPDLKTIRDVLEHYEDGYALGIGHLQQPGMKAWKRTLDAALSEEWTVVPDYAEGDNMRPIVTVADHYVLDLGAATTAAEQLLFSLWRRARDI